MSAEMHVLFGGKLPTPAALTRAMKELGFPLAIKPGIPSLAQHKGFMPMRLRREDSGVEFDVFDDPAAVADVARDQADPRFTRSANFRWGGDEDEMLCAMCAAAALAKLVDGMVAEENSERLLTPDEAVALARKLLDSVKPLPPTARGTRPADIKHYLKPLLELRSDLVVVGRRLLIRPFRHLLRGAFFDRTGDKRRFKVYRYLTPLYSANPYRIYGGELHQVSWDVWQPHFEPLLSDCLAQDVFDDLGRITTLQDCPMTVENLVLAGERDRAAELVERLLREPGDETVKRDLRSEWEHAIADVPVFCAEMHAREAEVVKMLKLEKFWEPSPFPAELPAAERVGKSAEPEFPVTPWIASPPWLWGEEPTEPGEVRFGKDLMWRNGRRMLVVPLTRDEAEARHRTRESHVLTACLPDGALLTIRSIGWDRNEPPDLGTRTPNMAVMLRIHLDRARHAASAFAWDQGNGVMELSSLDAYGKNAGPRWHCNISLSDNEKIIWDERTGESVGRRTPLTPTERELAVCPIPAFGEYATVVDRLRTLVQVLRYGDLT